MCTRKKIVSIIFSLVIILSVFVYVAPNSSWAAEKYPSRPITLVVGYAPGGMADSLTRLWIPYFEKYLGVPVVIEHKAGGAGVLSCTHVANAKPDGYTITSTGTVLFTAILLGQATYSLPGDLRVVAQLQQFTDGLAVRTDSPWKTFQEFMDYAKKNPGVVKYGNSGIGATPHLRMAYLAKYAGLDIVPLPFRTGPDLINAILGGHVPIGVYSVGSFKPLIDAGKLRLIFSFEPPAEFGFDPTISDFRTFFRSESPIDTPTYMVVPGKTPVEIVKVLEECAEKMTKEPGYLAELKKLYIRPNFIGSEAMQKILPEKMAHFKEVLRDAGLIK